VRKTSRPLSAEEMTSLDKGLPILLDELELHFWSSAK